jgi:hypothetical protein
MSTMVTGEAATVFGPLQQGFAKGGGDDFQRIPVERKEDS